MATDAQGNVTVKTLSTVMPKLGDADVRLDGMDLNANKVPDLPFLSSTIKRD